MAKTKVVNLGNSPYDVYIGRPSDWGNPFIIGRDGDREEVLDKYIKWIVKQDYLMNRLHELRGKTLGCYCVPKACHGHVLAMLADGEINV